MAAVAIITVVVSITGGLVGIVNLFKDHLARYYRYMKTEKNIYILWKKLRELKDLNRGADKQVRMGASGEKWENILMWAKRARDTSIAIDEDDDIDLDEETSFRIPIFLCIYIPKIYSRFKIGRLAVGWIDKIDELLNDARALNLVPISDFPNEEIMEEPVNLVGKKPNYAFGKMLMYIWDDEVRIIGVHGMGGVGKTALVSEIMIPIEKIFMLYGTSIWVDVPADGSDPESDLENVQLAIANKIKLVFSDTANSLERRAAELKNTLDLMQWGRYLLILDDMWRGFSLEEIGIPKPTRENGCKLIIISRYSSVCKTMKTDKNVELNLLSEDDEAWELFTNELGHSRISVLPEKIQMVLKEVAKQCGGLPSIIIQVARALRKITNLKYTIISEIRLEEVATQIKESIANFPSMVEKAFDRLKLSYDRLSSSTRSCFLYCALYPKGHYFGTKELIEYWSWDGLLSDEGSIEHTMQEAKNILHELKDVGFLESISEEGGIERIKVHPLIWDMAIYITKTTPNFLIKAGLGSRKPPLDHNNWPIDLQKASLMRNDLEDLSYQPNCPNLSSLLLQYNPLTGGFCDNFFHDMLNLKVLDLSYTGVHMLPKSLSSLRNLRALFLRNCWNLMSLPSLSNLVSLMVFDHSDTHIREIPQGMDRLIKLKRLDLSRTFVEIFPPGLLNKFEHLKELLMDGCGFLWGSESLYPSKRPYIEDLFSLENTISNLELNFRNSQVFHIFVNSIHLDRLKGFKFSVGGFYKGKLGTNSLAFIGESLVNGTPILLPSCTSKLHLTCCDNITQLTVPTSMNLKIVDVSECKNLKYLFKCGMLHHVPNLEEIAIRNCPNMEEVIEQEQRDNYVAVVITFRKLQKLILFNVPNLKSIYRGIVVCDSLQTIAVWKCDKLKKFPVMAHVDDEQKLASPCGLKEIMGEGTWLEEFECDLPDAKTVLQQLFIEVSSPHEIFTSKRTAPSPALINGSVSISDTDQWPMLHSGADQPLGHTLVSSQVPVQTNPVPLGPPKDKCAL